MQYSPLAVAMLVLASCASPDRQPASDTSAASETAPAETTAVTVMNVHQGTQGMAGQLRWAQSGDRRALIAVEDWASIEAEPFFDSFIMASEVGNRWIQQDSVWDVQPAPDWEQAAYGRATIIHAGEQGTVPPDSLAAVAGRMALPVDSVRAAEFAASGMGPASGLARLARRRLSDGTARQFSILAGWRVGWSGDGTSIFAGTGPRYAQEDSPPMRWLRVDDDGARVVPVSTPDTAPVAWQTGATLDISVTPDTTPPPISTDGGTLATRGGMIYLGNRTIGRGAAVAATRSGCFILALAPDSLAGEYDPKWRAVVYRSCGG